MAVRTKVSPEAEALRRQILDDPNHTVKAVAVPGKRDTYRRPSIPKSLTRKIGMLKVDDRQFEMTVSNNVAALPYTIYEVQEGGMAMGPEHAETLGEALKALYDRAMAALPEHMG